MILRDRIRLTVRILLVPFLPDNGGNMIQKRLFLLFFFLGCLGTMTYLFAQQTPQTVLLVNHTGYSLSGEKKTVLQTHSSAVPSKFQVIDSLGQVVFENTFSKGGAIDRWHTGKVYAGFFTDLKKPGTYQIKTVFAGLTVTSSAFMIGKNGATQNNLALLLDGFVSQHPIKKYDDRDRNIPFESERKGTVDAHGGWSDASGDIGKHLSHLSHAIYMNPQQTPLVVWSLLESMNQLMHKNVNNELLLQNMRKETAYGADSLVRLQDPEGYFYISINDQEWSRDPARRFIANKSQGKDGTGGGYQAAMREGAGITIAALARACSDGIKGEYSPETYLKTAEKGFAHLKVNNLKYLYDGKENIIDDYCALMASTELFIASNKVEYLAYARNRANNLINRLSSDNNYKGWWRADDLGKRPFFHAADEGFPLVALSRFLAIEKQDVMRQKVITTLRTSVDFELGITAEVNNPFGYARQYIKAVNESTKRSAFFLPRKNETGYWWQGENARLASLASAFSLVMPYLSEIQKPRARRYAADQIDWILGLNPFDMCMLDGTGRNNPPYYEDAGNLNYRGGVCNGITGGDDEHDIAFMPPPYDKDINNRWRWAEQWLPHSSWLMLALAASMAD